MKRLYCKLIALSLSCALAIGMFSGVGTSTSTAAAKPKLSAKKLSLKIGNSKKVSVKNAKKAKITWKLSSKSKAKLKKTNKYTVKVTAKKAGSTNLICQVKKGKTSKKLTCKITIAKKATAKASTSPTQTPVIPTATPTVVTTPSAVPTQTPAPTPVGTPANLLQAFDGVIEHVGTCMGYNTSWNNGYQLKTAKVLESAKQHFNSFTLENEMKPDQVMPYNSQTISVADAKALGYVIPDSYQESTVLKLNFDTIDKVLDIAYKNNLKMRGHTFMWHQQTKTYFYKQGYNDSSANASKETMNARIEFYVRTIMKHVMDKEKALTGTAGSIVYAWDVVNEYTHRTNVPTSPSWMDIYGDMKLNPTYVKLAFSTAYDMLKQYGLNDSVTLFYNDYDTYDVTDDMIELINYINQGEPEKICRGVGMQAHVSTDYPTVSQFGATIAKFAAQGLEIQITELDVKNTSDTVQATYMKNLFTEILAQKKAGANITGITVWGVYDSVSWIPGENPLIFSGVTTLKDETGKITGYKFTEKPSYYAIIDALMEYKGLK